MKNVKKYPKKQLEKYSSIFVQLSLVLVLFVVYQMLEYKTAHKNQRAIITESTDSFVFLAQETPVDFVKEKKVIVKKEAPQILILDLIDTSKDEENVVEAVLPEKEPIENTVADINAALDAYIPEVDAIIEDVDFIVIEDAPIYKGCEGLSKEENKKCFIKSIQKFVIKRFDVDLAQELGLRPGTYRIFAQFVIGKDGLIHGVKIKAPHHKLEKEVKRIVKKLPQFTPGLQRKVPVNVKFTLPISFKVA